MKKLTVRVFGLLLGVILLVLEINSLWEMYMWNSSTYRKMPDKITIANTGSSHGVFGIDYKDYEENAFNFAMISQSLEYDYELIDYYSDQFSEDSILLIVVSWYALWYDELEEESFESKNTRYFAVLDKEHMRFNENKNSYRNKNVPFINVINREVGNVFKEGINAGSVAEEKTLRKIGEERAAAHLKLIISETGEVLPVLENNREAIIKLVELCKRHDIIPVIVTTPYLSEYSDNYPKEVKNVFNRTISEICVNYEIEHWDFSEDERFCNSVNLFSDTDHLNGEGAKLFTGLIMENIQKKYLKYV